VLNFVEIGQTAAEILRFCDFSRWRPPPSFGFSKFENFNGRTALVEVRRRAKFGRNLSNCGRDMAILYFSKMAAAAVLDFQNFKYSTVGGF